MDVLQFGLYNLGVLSNLAWTLVERDILLCGPDRQTERCEHEFQALQPLSLLSLAAAMADSLNKSGSHHSPGLLSLFSSCAGCYSRDWLTCNNSRPPPPPPPPVCIWGAATTIRGLSPWKHTGPGLQQQGEACCVRVTQ